MQSITTPFRQRTGAVSPASLQLRAQPSFAAQPRAAQTRGARYARLEPRAGLAIPPKSQAPLPPGPKFFLPLVGDTISIVQEPIKFFDDRVNEYGPVFKTHFAGEECVAVADATLIQEIYVSEHEAVSFDIAKSIAAVTQSKLLPVSRKGKSAEKEHKIDRQFLGKYFTAASIASYYPFMQSFLEDQMKSWVEMGDAVKFADETKAFAFAVMNTQLAGVEFSAKQLEELDHLFYDFTNGAIDLLAIDLPWTAFGKGKVADAKICDVIRDALEKSYGAGIENRDFEDTNMVTGFLVQKNEDGSWKYSIEEAAKAMRSILFAGHETTAGSICIMMHFVARHPEVLEKVREEQRELAERYGPDLTPEILEGTYTEAVAVECFRLQNIDQKTRSPSMLQRRALVDFEVGGKLIKQGQKLVLASGYTASRIEEFLPTVEDFEPERWVIPGKSAVATYKAKKVSIFGGGQRVCAGEALAWAEMKVFLALLGRNVSWDIINPDAEWKRAQGSLFKSPEDGMLIRFSSLQNETGDA